MMLLLVFMMKYFCCCHCFCFSVNIFLVISNGILLQYLLINFSYTHLIIFCDHEIPILWWCIIVWQKNITTTIVYSNDVDHTRVTEQWLRNVSHSFFSFLCEKHAQNCKQATTKKQTSLCLFQALFTEELHVSSVVRTIVTSKGMTPLQLSCPYYQAINSILELHVSSVVPTIVTSKGTTPLFTVVMPLLLGNQLNIVGSVGLFLPTQSLVLLAAVSLIIGFLLWTQTLYLVMLVKEEEDCKFLLIVIFYFFRFYLYHIVVNSISLRITWCWYDNDDDDDNGAVELQTNVDPSQNITMFTIIHPASSFNTKCTEAIQNLAHKIKYWCCW